MIGLKKIVGQKKNTVHLTSKVVFYHRSSFIKGCLPSKIVFHQRLSSIKGCLPSKVVFHQILSSIKGCLPSNIVFHQRESSIKMVLIKQNCQFQDISYFSYCWTVGVSKLSPAKLGPG